MSENQLLIIAPTPAARDVLAQAARECGLSAEFSASFEGGRAAIEQSPPALVLAENPPDDEAMNTLQKTLMVHAPVTPLIIYLPARDSALALKRMMAGAYDCVCPPLSPGDLLSAGKRAVMRVGRRLLTSRTLTPVPWWRHPSLYISAGLALFLGLLGLGLMGLWSPPFQMYKLATDHPVGLAGDGTTLWVADWSQQNLTDIRVQGDYVSILQVKRMADFQPVAVAAAPFYYYTASADGRLRRHRRDEDLAVVASVASPAAAPSGLAWDGETLWSCDSDTGKIYQHDPQMGVKSSFQSPAEKPVGLAWHKKSLWVADGKTLNLWKLTPQGTEWKKEGPCPLDVFAHNRALALSGFTVWRDRLWLVSETGGVLIQHRLPEGK